MRTVQDLDPGLFVRAGVRRVLRWQDQAQRTLRPGDVLSVLCAHSGRETLVVHEVSHV